MVVFVYPREQKIKTLRFMGFQKSENNEKNSVHSSNDDAKESTASVPFDESYISSGSFADEQIRLEKKIEKIRKKITKNSLEREADVERFLNVVNKDGETAQMARLKQNFERKNKKYSQEAELLQKKLEECEQRLQDLENGLDSSKHVHAHRALLQNVGQGITRTGANLKEMAGTVINTPLDIAKSVKRNVFGSADNIANASEDVFIASFLDKNVGGVGKSIFYDNTEYSPKKEDDKLQQQRPSDSNEAHPSITEHESSNRLSQQFAEDSEHTKKFLQELLAIKQQNNNLQRAFETLKRETDNEMRTQRAEIISLEMDSRFKIQQLEQNLNESMELYQNEVKQLKSDLSLIGTRLDYQYNDRFKKIEESVEGVQNRLYRMETSWHENSEKLLGAGQNMWNALIYSGANVLIEVLKIILYFIAVVLDMVKPLTGTRQRAGFVLIGLLILFFAYQLSYSFFGSSDEPAAPLKPGKEL
ncbi:hypothetical protein M3Y97_00234300 [Aphelenchoides bicaudatus]|nr:hypothetical protein M3Y97_00234300 [Aphelenchoides bicaudatus]